MSWTRAQLLAAGSSPLAYQVVVDGASMVVSSAPQVLAGHGWIAGDPVESGMGLTMRTWETSGGQMTIPLQVPGEHEASWLADWEIGARVEVFAQEAGGSPFRIWLGRLIDVPHDPETGGYVAVIGDAVSMTTQVPRPGWGATRLFEDAGETWPVHLFQSSSVNNYYSGGLIKAVRMDVVGNALTAHVPSTTPGNLTLLSTTGFQRGYSFITAAAEGCVMVQGAGSTAAGSVPYFLLYSGISSPNLTGAYIPNPARIQPPHEALTGTDPVRHVPWVDGHAMDIIRAVMCSSSSGTNGPFDVLPASWGVGFPTADVDHLDVAQWYVVMKEPTVPRYSLAVMESMEDGMGPVWEWASKLGVWPVMRHGSVSLRAALSPHDTAAPGLSAMSITDANIRDRGARYNRHPDSTHIVQNVLLAHSSFVAGSVADDGAPIPTSASATGAAPYGWPRQYSVTLDLTAAIFHDIGDQRKDAGRRIAPWWHSFASAVEVTLHGDESMGLVTGDVVTVTSSVLLGPDGATLSSTPAIAIPTARRWGGRETDVTLVFLRQP